MFNLHLALNMRLPVFYFLAMYTAFTCTVVFNLSLRPDTTTQSGGSVPKAMPKFSCSTTGFFGKVVTNIRNWTFVRTSFIPCTGSIHCAAWMSIPAHLLWDNNLTVQRLYMIGFGGNSDDRRYSNRCMLVPLSRRCFTWQYQGQIGFITSSKYSTREKCSAIFYLVFHGEYSMNAFLDIHPSN